MHFATLNPEAWLVEEIPRYSKESCQQLFQKRLDRGKEVPGLMNRHEYLAA